MIEFGGGRSRGCAGHKRMVDSFIIKNFRSFDEVKVEGCRRINVLVGDNGSGKTALLEALFLAAGVSPEIVIRTRSWRGYSGGQMTGSPEDLHQALWGDLFHKFQSSHPALISLKGKGEENRSVTVTLNRRGQMEVIPPSRKRPGSAPRLVPVSSPIQFKWKIRGFHDVTVEPRFESGQIIFPPVPVEPVRASFYAANNTPPPWEMTSRLSMLSQSFHEMEFNERFSEIFPNISNLSVEMNAGAAMIFAAVEGLPQKLPLSLASGGMNKLASILLAITALSGGIVIVDEIENGFYYKHLPKVWEALLSFARSYDCQLFVSTHSSECLQAAAKLAEKNGDDFAMMRTVRERDGTRVRRFDGERFASAVFGNVEVR